jgi:hypothetical protein
VFRKYSSAGVAYEDLSEFPAAAAIADDTATPTTTQIASFTMIWDSTNGDWDRARSSSLNADAQAAHSKGVMDVAANLFFYNGTTFDRARGDTTYGLDVDVTRLPAVSLTKPTTGTNSTVADNAASVTILASNSSRIGATVTNDSSANLYLLLGSTTASTTNYTVILTRYSYYEVPFGYTGQLTGIWASDPGDGAARVTELT